VDINQYLVGGELKPWTGETCPVYSPIWTKAEDGKPAEVRIIEDKSLRM
jgi:hypothetical protein